MSRFLDFPGLSCERYQRIDQIRIHSRMDPGSDDAELCRVVTSPTSLKWCRTRRVSITGWQSEGKKTPWNICQSFPIRSLMYIFEPMFWALYLLHYILYMNIIYYIPNNKLLFYVTITIIHYDFLFNLNDYLNVLKCVYLESNQRGVRWS